MSKTVAILLAAGQSSRMGARNKLLLPIAGVPMIRHMVSLYHAVTALPVVVITGHQEDQVRKALEGAPTSIHFNPDYADGQATSVGLGLRIAPKAEQFFIGLGDQPELQSTDLVQLLQAHFMGDPAKISIPRQGDQRGNPIVVPTNLRARLLEDPRAPGCKRFTRENPEHVQFHDLPQRGFYADVDTPEAYAALPNTLLEATT